MATYCSRPRGGYHSRSALWFPQGPQEPDKISLDVILTEEESGAAPHNPVDGYEIHVSRAKDAMSFGWYIFRTLTRDTSTGSAGAGPAPFRVAGVCREVWFSVYLFSIYRRMLSSRSYRDFANLTVIPGKEGSGASGWGSHGDYLNQTIRAGHRQPVNSISSG
jgi:hypothetical protein